MGCNQSQEVEGNGSTANGSPATPRTKGANGTSGRSRSDTLDQPAANGRAVQWKRLLDTIPCLEDPADVESVYDSLLCSQANRLSAVQVQFLRKAIRKTIQELPQKKVLGGNSNNTARSILEKHHLLPSVVLSRVLPPSPLQTALIHCCRTWSHSDAIVATAVAAQNPTTMTPAGLGACIRTTEQPLDGATLLSLTALLGMGLYGSRNQQLALLFAMLADHSSNSSNSATTTTTNDTPYALLEMESGVALSKASLVHYHTHGWTALPVPWDDQGGGVLVSSKSATTIPSARAVTILQQAVSGHEWPVPEESTVEASSSSSMILLQQPPAPPPPPSALQLALERDTVKGTFVEWQEHDGKRWNIVDFTDWAASALSDEAIDAAMHNLLARGILPSAGLEREIVTKKDLPTIFGGLGNIDQKGGLGGGLRYCIPKAWWDSWQLYVTKKSRERPPPLTTDILLKSEQRGIGGSFEVMKSGLVRERDYVLVSPAIWNALYELYGGGPPLPRMVSTDHKLVLYPWILNVYLCDPIQPYRRGESLSIRCMSEAKQPLSRLLGEIICRFPQLRSESVGRMRLWKFVETLSKAGKPILTRFGPWNLLCENRHATIPPTSPDDEEGDWMDVMENWKVYSKDATVESIGLKENDSLLVEFAVPNKSGVLTWPREAAAEEGRKRVIAEEDLQFRRMLQGQDSKGTVLLKPKSLVGMEVDASDRSGRWYTVKILDVQIMDDDTDEEIVEEDEHAEVTDEPVTRKKAKVPFPNGHFEWIDVASDRIAIAGRMVSTRQRGDPDADKAHSPTNGASNGGASRSRSIPTNGRSGSNAGETTIENGKLCPFPGFGSCGLTNLGNTCYMNSAVQCIAYLPLLRSYLLSGQYKASGDLNKDNPLGTGGKLLEEFAELLRAVWNAKQAEHRPFKFKQSLAKTNEQFSGGDQQDAQEFLTYMIDMLHEDSNRVRKKPYVVPMEDEWVANNPLSRVGEEAWRRFLRRNRSIMSDVIMGQTVNTVTCPVCSYKSRSFDPFNLLSLPIPATAEVIFQCTVYRRATAENCPVLNRPRKGESQRSARYNFSRNKHSNGPPSTSHIAEQYVISMSRLADCGDLKLQIQNLSGISAKSIHKVCRIDEVHVNDSVGERSVLRRRVKINSLQDKDSPARKRVNTDDPTIQQPIQIIAFESTLSNRTMDLTPEAEEAKDEDGPTDPKQTFIKRVEKFLSVYGDGSECRLLDSDPVGLAQAVSRSLWPASEEAIKKGMRVDAKDKGGVWYAGSVVDVVARTTDGDEEEGGTVRVHFDNFVAKWDEEYTFKQVMEQKAILPLYSMVKPRGRHTEFTVFNRFRYGKSSLIFGQSFYIQCKNDWSHARSGAHLLAQTSRFLQSNSGKESSKLVEDVVTNLSDFIDLLLEYDREYIRLALGMSKYNSSTERAQPCRNPGFDGESYVEEFNKHVARFLKSLPFEISVSQGVDSTEKRQEEIPFPFWLNRAIGNFVGSVKGAGNSFILQWKDTGRSSEHRKSSDSSSSKRPDILYFTPKTHVHTSSAEILRVFTAKQTQENGSKAMPDAELNLGDCLQEYCKQQKLQLSDMWKCPKCKAHREGLQGLSLWRLPDLLTFHIKRFNMSARWHERIGTKVEFPMTGLNVKEWCHESAPVEDCMYDLIGVINHYGSMTGGHYVATCKATACGKEGQEDVAYSFNGTGVQSLMGTNADNPLGWLGRSKPKSSQHRAESASKTVADSAEPLWLQFDDEVVEPVSPRHVVSEMAYVLFYRRRNLTPSNVAKYSTLG